MLPLYLKVVDPPLGLVVPNSAQLCWVQVVTEKKIISNNNPISLVF